MFLLFFQASVVDRCMMVFILYPSLIFFFSPSTCIYKKSSPSCLRVIAIAFISMFLFLISIFYDKTSYYLSKRKEKKRKENQYFMISYYVLHNVVCCLLMLLPGAIGQCYLTSVLFLPWKPFYQFHIKKEKRKKENWCAVC